MKQFLTILQFELKNFFKNKAFIGVTAFFVIAVGAVMFFPRLMSNSESVDPVSEGREAMLIVADDEFEDVIAECFSNSFYGYDVKAFAGGEEKAKEEIINGNAECAFVFDSLVSFTYYVKDLSLYDRNAETASEMIKTVNYYSALLNAGVSEEEAERVISFQAEGRTESLGKDQTRNFFYAYIMIFALYIVIMLYGQMVSTNVATEKSSRAMELLITSAKPVSMMFGKVLAACIAGLFQIVAIFGSALLFFNINREFWDSELANMFLDIPPELLGYMAVFFLFGFLLYAFLYGAIGSTVSKLEDVNTAVTPLTLMFVIAFVVVTTAMSSGSVDTVLIKVCSFFPFTSPMAMFTRIALSTVPFYEIAISVALLAVSVVGTGFAAAKIYRVGVLMYGTRPKFTDLIKMIKKA